MVHKTVHCICINVFNSYPIFIILYSSSNAMLYNSFCIKTALVSHSLYCKFNTFLLKRSIGNGQFEFFSIRYKINEDDGQCYITETGD